MKNNQIKSVSEVVESILTDITNVDTEEQLRKSMEETLKDRDRVMIERIKIDLEKIVQPEEDRADFMGDDYVDIDRDLRKYISRLEEELT